MSAFQERLEFLARSGIDRVRLLGGEPTLHPQFAQLVQRARAAGKKVTVFSNGLMPDSAVRCLEAIPPPGCRVVINVNEPDTPQGQENLQRQRETLRRLAAQAMLGFNIYRTDFRLDFLLELIAQTGCQRLIRLSMAQPCLSGTNQHLRPNQYPIVGHKIASFAHLAGQAGVVLDFDCGFVRCMFSDADLELLHTAGAKTAWECSPILDVDLQGQVIHCYPLSQLMRLPLTPAADAAALRSAFEARCRPYRQAGVFRECSTCQFKRNGECSGGCLSATILRFRRSSFSLRVPALDRELLEQSGG